VATEDELETMANAWEKWKDREDANLRRILGEILIQK
jgi:hypothetical protein